MLTKHGFTWWHQTGQRRLMLVTKRASSSSADGMCTQQRFMPLTRDVHQPDMSTTETPISRKYPSTKMSINQKYPSIGDDHQPKMSINRRCPSTGDVHQL